VHFAGMQTDVRPFLRSADAFCLPSSSEGMPNAVLEAMACGIPSIVTPVSGVKDLLVQNGVCGRIVDSTATAIADSLWEYVSEPALASEHGTTARFAAEKFFSSTEILRQTLDVFGHEA